MPRLPSGRGDVGDDRTEPPGHGRGGCHDRRQSISSESGHGLRELRRSKRVDTGTTSAVILGLLTSIGFRIRFGGLTVALIVACVATGDAQQASISADRLVLVPQLVAGRSADSSGTELTVRWGAAAGGAPETIAPGDARPAPGVFELIAERSVSGLPSVERDPQLSEDVLVVFGVGANGVEEGWQIVRDPTIVRAEAPDASGLLSGQVLRRTNTTFVVTIPVPSTLQELRIYKPRWTGASFVLDPAGVLSLSATAR
jgi:hypothetical protein